MSAPATVTFALSKGRIFDEALRPLIDALGAAVGSGS
jgi:hypothetical protein